MVKKLSIPLKKLQQMVIHLLILHLLMIRWSLPIPIHLLPLLCKFLKFGMMMITKMASALLLFLSHSLQMANLLYLLSPYLILAIGNILGLIYLLIKTAKKSPIPFKKPLLPTTKLLIKIRLKTSLPSPTPIHQRPLL